MKNRLTYRFIVLGIVVVISRIVSYEVQEIIGLCLIVLGGIPHGANDWRVDQLLSGKINLKSPSIRFFIRYLLVALGFVLVWILMPFRALIIFLVISAYHFGQSEMERILTTPENKRLPFLLWGVFALGFPLILHWGETIRYIETLTATQLPLINSTPIILITVSSILILFLLFQTASNQINGSQLGYLLTSMAILILIFSTTSLLLGFAVYFVVWHSTDAIHLQLEFINRKKKYEIKNWIKDTMPFSILAIFFLVAVMFLIEFDDVQSLGALVFIFISAITIPHMLITEKMVDSKLNA
ncbi:MAG: beta-carotene 15,15'-dioxygenase, Brp/Blh family [Maribacter sp.]|nr:beta-carotene 15,15'-dioxygenase, Brp/Blh family [Maribacter sp.]